MKLQIGTLLCIFGAAACSTNKPAEGAYDSQTVAVDSTPATPSAADETLTPASAEGSAVASSSGAASTPAATTPANRDTGSAPAATTAEQAPPADNTGNKSSKANAAPDNTKVNERDRKASALTPMDQGEGQTDLKITQQIRQAVMGDGSLSFTAKNVKIITQNGKVTLRGPVKTEQERTAIEAAARKIAGADKVDNQLEVKQ